MASQFGICDLTLVPMRSSTNDRSEMVSQLLFGETFEITDREKQWVKIRTAFDDYEGWIDEKQFQPISIAHFNIQKNQFVGSDKLAIAKSKFREVQVLMGSSIPSPAGKEFKINEEVFQFEGNYFPFADSPFTSPVSIIDSALKFIDAPYLWGGRSLFGIDCSGFTQIVFKLAGKNLKRDANQQAEQGTTINFMMEAKPSDLAFFENEEKKITHVGIILSDGKIIHASGKVRIDNLDHFGIFNQENKKYSHKLRIIKRIL